MEMAIARGGHAWRGYFPVGEELTSGVVALRLTGCPVFFKYFFDTPKTLYAQIKARS
jgi:hypothetical protein